MTLQKDHLNHHWTLFLDRDGVINQRIVDGYVTSVDLFVMETGAADAIAGLAAFFGKIIVVTNQQGIAKGLMTEHDLEDIHKMMTDAIAGAGGRVDAVLHCPDLAGKKKSCRKPNVTMGLQAKKMFPEIHFKKSVMVGDSFTDMLFAQRLGMRKVFVNQNLDRMMHPTSIHTDLMVPSLSGFYKYVVENNGLLPPVEK